MIKSEPKILKNRKYKRILELSEDSLMITTLDSRFYRRNGKYYPSITHVLSVFPKGPHYEDWLKRHGFTSEHIAKKAAEEGTETHELCELYLLGEELHFLNERQQPKYKPDVWNMFLRFVDFWETYNPTLLETEVHLFSDKLKIAGTCDIVCEIDGEIWIIDLKTSNAIQDVYEIQTSIYKECYEECFGKKVAKTRILWLKSSSRGPDKNNKKIQGKNWQLIEPQRKHERNLEIFNYIRAIFDLINPKSEPNHISFKTIVKRKN